MKGDVENYKKTFRGANIRGGNQMSILGILFFVVLILIFIFVLKNKSKTGVLLYVFYLVLFPFIIILSETIQTVFCAVAGIVIFFALIGVVFIYGIGLYVLKKLKGRENPVIKLLKSKQLKLAFCSLLFFALVYAEFFNGVETFQNKENYFEIKSEIGMNRFLPYRVDAVKHYNSGNVISLYSDISTFYSAQKHLYLYNGILYWEHIPRILHHPDKEEDNPPNGRWARWGEKGDYT